jgi:hypothetical protein
MKLFLRDLLSLTNEELEGCLQKYIHKCGYTDVPIEEARYFLTKALDTDEAVIIPEPCPYFIPVPVPVDNHTEDGKYRILLSSAILHKLSRDIT